MIFCFIFLVPIKLLFLVQNALKIGQFLLTPCCAETPLWPQIVNHTNICLLLVPDLLQCCQSIDGDSDSSIAELAYYQIIPCWRLISTWVSGVPFRYSSQGNGTLVIQKASSEIVSYPTR